MTDMSHGFCDISCSSNVPKVRIFPWWLSDWKKKKWKQYNCHCRIEQNYLFVLKMLTNNKKNGRIPITIIYSHFRVWIVTLIKSKGSWHQIYVPSPSCQHTFKQKYHFQWLGIASEYESQLTRNQDWIFWHSTSYPHTVGWALFEWFAS